MKLIQLSERSYILITMDGKAVIYKARRLSGCTARLNILANILSLSGLAFVAL